MEVQLQLVKATARHVRYFLGQAVDVQCNGCRVNHGSQLQHECVMLSGEDRIRFGLHQDLVLVDWDKVKEDFDHSCSSISSYDSHWIKNLWNDQMWYEQLVSSLVMLERNGSI